MKKYAVVDDNGTIISVVNSNKPIIRSDYIETTESTKEILRKQHNGVSFEDKKTVNDVSITLVKATGDEYSLNSTITGTVETSKKITGVMYITFVDLSKTNAILCKCTLSKGEGTWSLDATEQGIFYPSNLIDAPVFNNYSVNPIKLIIIG